MFIYVAFKQSRPRIQRCLLSLITSNMEGFSLALSESLAHGVPVISYDIKYGPSELITSDFNGYLITKNDEDALFDKVKCD